MTDQPLDLRDLAPRRRHETVFETFEALESGESLTLINDHNPRPLIRQMEGTLEAFDAEACSIEQEGDNRFVIELPKRQPPAPDTPDEIETALADIEDPDLGVSIVDSGLVTDTEVGVDRDSGEPEATVVLNTMGLGDEQEGDLVDAIRDAIAAETEIRRVQIVAGEGVGPSGGPSADRDGTKSGDDSNVQAISKSKARERLRDVQHPEAAGDVVETGIVTDVTVDGGAVTASVDTSDLTAGSRERRRELFDRMGAALYNAHGVSEVRIDTGDGTARIDPPRHEDPAMTDTHDGSMGGMPGAQGTTPLQQADQQSRAGQAPPTLDITGIETIVLVASAKGGVGKTTVATQLARGLADGDTEVGLLDADFSGPDVPRVLDLEPRITRGSVIDPIEFDGIEVMSVGLMENHPTAWNGEMVHNALFNLLEDVDWGAETLVVDLPPGVSDTMMTMLQFVPIDGVVLVTTPYPTSIADTNEGAELFREGDVPVVGAVVNMAGYECPSCGDSHDLFEDGGHEGALEFPVLDELPFSESLRSFEGEPPEQFVELAETVAGSLPDGGDVEVPDGAIDIRDMPDRGRYEAVEDGFRTCEPGDTLSIVSDRHPAGLAVALVELVDGDGGPTDVFDEYSVTSIAPDKWLLTVRLPESIDARAG